LTIVHELPYSSAASDAVLNECSSWTSHVCKKWNQLEIDNKLSYGCFVAECTGTAALADNNGIAQLFRCNSRGPLGFRNITSKEKQFDFGSTNRVADLVSIGDGGVSGLDIVLFRTTFNSIQWYFKAASDSKNFYHHFTDTSSSESVQHAR
jgi:hypothetical protein